MGFQTHIFWVFAVLVHYPSSKRHIFCRIARSEGENTIAQNATPWRELPCAAFAWKYGALHDPPIMSSVFPRYGTGWNTLKWQQRDWVQILVMNTLTANWIFYLVCSSHSVGCLVIMELIVMRDSSTVSRSKIPDYQNKESKVFTFTFPMPAV